MDSWKKRIEITKMAVITAIQNYENANDGQKITTQANLKTMTKRFGDEIHRFIEKINENDIQEYTELQLQAELLTTEQIFNKNLDNQTKLPKLELQKFDGNILHWREFHDRFQTTIDTKPISEADKLAYLVTSLQGEALAFIRGLECTNDNYPIALKVLKDRFGKLGLVIDAHYLTLLNLRKASSSAKDYLEVYNEIERHPRVLNGMGENTNHNLRTIILNKFPNDIIYELKKIVKTEDTQVDVIRKELEHIISAQMTTHSNLTPSDNQSSTVHTLHLKEQNERKTVKRRFISKSVSNIKKREHNPCIFCKGNHFNDQCQTKSISERKKLLKNRCYICFQENHQARFCKEKRKCFHCGAANKHNSALCDSKKETFTGSNSSKHNTILQTAITHILSKNQSLVKWRLLLDTWQSEIIYY
ncbi:hypothetical protein K1T71_011674 [Dendrolimus kikuchii]|uniref:Uncharacterized protein n=1 Tax=Dendrolimus kikuchii TaxID=765133 RepID=A0ACC1CLR3_9NEOP|nr:hypothetical protein K1T71_011674 [Dendrolimus kikuchii]